MTKIELRDYDLLGNLDDEESVLDDFTNGYSGSTYICDAITESADNACPIYHSDIWSNVADIQEYIEEAVAEGLVETTGRNFDLLKLFQVGYYEFYTQSIYRNLDTMVFNMIATQINDYLDSLDEEELEKIDIDMIEEEIEDISEDYDNNNKFSDIEDSISNLISEIEDGEYSKEEEDDE